MTALSPGEQVIKIVRDELVEILGKDPAARNLLTARLRLCSWRASKGSGKTTSSGKLANWFKTGGHRPATGFGGRLPSRRTPELKVVAKAVKANV